MLIMIKHLDDVLKLLDGFGQRINRECLQGYLGSQLKLAKGPEKALKYLGLEKPKNLFDRAFYNVGYLIEKYQLF